MGHARNERYTRIRTRAAEIWQEEGCPGNQHERHWLLAMRQIDREDAGRKPARANKPVRAKLPVVAEPVIRLPGSQKARSATLGARLRSSRV